MASLLPNGKQHFDDNNGRPLVGGRVYYYIPNTSTPKDTWQDEAMTILNTNPIILDARGECTAWGYGSYRQVVRDFFGNLIWDRLVTDFTEKIDTAIADLSGDLSGPGGSDLVGFLQSGAGAVARTAQSKMRESLTGADFNAQGDGSNQTSQVQNLIAEGTARSGVAELAEGDYGASSPLTLIPNGTVSGVGSQSTSVSRLGAGSMFSSPLQNYVGLKGLTIDMRHSISGESGHGLTSTGNYVRVEDVTVKDLGGTSAGTGLLVFQAGADKPEGPRFINCSIFGDPAAPASFGWIFESTRHGFASGIYAQNIVGYAHELKNDAIYNNLTHLTAYLSNWALAHGQDTVGVDGADFNVAMAVVGNACDGGWIVGEGTYNLTSGAIFNSTGSPGREADTSLVRLSGSAAGNAACDILGLGSFTQTVLFSGNRNYARVLTHDTSSTVLRIGAGSRQNVLEVAHPGNRTSIRGTIDDQSGQGLTGSTANVVHSPGTGERIGSISGYFSDVLGQSGAAFNGNHRWRYEHSQYAIHAFATPGNTGDSVGLTYAIPGSAIHGKILYAKGATGPADYWSIGINTADAYYLTPASIRPNPDNTKSCGEATYRWTVVYAVTTTISSSDANLKKIRGPLTDAEMQAWARVQPAIYQWLDAVAEKGEDGARLHAGYIAQEVEAAFTSVGLDPRRYAMFCEDEVFDTVKVKRMVSRQRFDTETVRTPRIEVVDGRAMQTFVEETTEIPLYELIPLVDADGNAVLDEKGVAVMHQVPAMHDVEEEVEEQRPAGKRLALRYDHCAVFEAAYQRRRAELVESRLAALEARP